MLHVCGNHIEIERFTSYPVQALNWDIFAPGNPSLAHVHANSDKVVAGGIPYDKLRSMDFGEIKAATEKSVEGIKNRVMLAGGCAVDPLLDSQRRRYVRDVAENIRYE